MKKDIKFDIDTQKYNDYIQNAAEKVSRISFLNINPDKKTVTVVFIVAIAVIALLSGGLIIGEVVSDEGNQTTAAPEETTDSSYVMTAATAGEINANFLFALTTDEEITLLGVMRGSSQQGSIKVGFLSPQTYCSFNNLQGTMTEHYQQGGINQLLWAVGEYAGISIERYILADEDAFASVLERVGECEVYLESQVVCGHDAASFIIEKGQQKLIPAMMEKYFCFLCDNQPLYNNKLIETMALFSKKLFCGEGEDFVGNSVEYLVSCLQTNVTAFDFNDYKPCAMELMKQEVFDNMAVVENISELK